MDVEMIIGLFGYVGIFLLMAANGLLSFPSSQILYIIVGYLVGTGSLLLVPATFCGALGNMFGNWALYEGVRAYGLDFARKVTTLNEREMRKAEIVFRRRGTWFLFIGKLLPAIKVFIPIAAGLTKVRREIFIPIMFFASWIWSLIFVGVGYFFGKHTDVWKSYGILLMLIAGLLMYLFYRLMNSPTVLRELEEGAQPSEK